jgi:hypothetical protein
MTNIKLTSTKAIAVLYHTARNVNKLATEDLEGWVSFITTKNFM